MNIGVNYNESSCRRLKAQELSSRGQTRNLRTRFAQSELIEFVFFRIEAQQKCVHHARH